MSAAGRNVRIKASDAVDFPIIGVHDDVTVRMMMMTVIAKSRHHSENEHLSDFICSSRQERLSSYHYTACNKHKNVTRYS